jgi:hypothetical protein
LDESEELYARTEDLKPEERQDVCAGYLATIGFTFKRPPAASALNPDAEEVKS